LKSQLDALLQQGQSIHLETLIKFAATMIRNNPDLKAKLAELKAKNPERVEFFGNSWASKWLTKNGYSWRVSTKPKKKHEFTETIREEFLYRVALSLTILSLKKW